MLVKVTGGVRKGLTYTVFGMDEIPDIDDKIRELSSILAEKGKKKIERLIDHLITVVITIPVSQP